MLVWEEIIEEVDGLDVLEAEVLQIPDKIAKKEVDEEEAAAVRRQVFQSLDTEGTGVLGREQVQRLVQEIDGSGARFVFCCRLAASSKDRRRHLSRPAANFPPRSATRCTRALSSYR